MKKKIKDCTIDELRNICLSVDSCVDCKLYISPSSQVERCSVKRAFDWDDENCLNMEVEIEI